MTQSTDITLSNQSGSSYRGEHNSINQALVSTNQGSTAPTYAITGTQWIDDSATPWVLKVYNGTEWISITEINTSTNKHVPVNLGDGDSTSDAANIGQIQDGDFTWLGTSSGTNTITASATPPIDGYKAGQLFKFIVGGTNTGAVTLNVNSKGTKAIQNFGSALAPGDNTVGDVVLVVYDGTQFQKISLAKNNTFTGNNTFSGGVVIPDGAVQSDVNTLGDTGGGAVEIDLDDGRTITATVSTAETTFTFINVLSTGNPDAFDLILTNGGSQTVNWPASVDWEGGTAPTLTTSGIDHLVFTTVDGGTPWYGYVAGLDMQ